MYKHTHVYMYFPCIDTHMCGYVYVYIQEMLSFQKCSGLQVNLKGKAKTQAKSRDFEIFASKDWQMQRNE